VSTDVGGCRVRGAFVVQIREAFREHGRLERIDASFAPELRAIWTSATPSALVDERVVVAGLVAARRELCLDDAAWRALLRDQCTRAIQRHYRLFLRFVTPRLLFGAVPRMWSLTHSEGSVVPDRWGDRSVRLAYLDHAPLAVRESQDLTIAVVEALAALNRTEVEVTAVPCADPARRFEVDLAW
jgi:hypothetical protein